MSNASEKAPKPAREKGRFVKGNSGNPNGRPKKERSDDKLDLGLLEVLQAPVVMHTGDKKRTITKGRALVETLTDMALKRDPKAFALLTALLKHQKLIDPAPPEQLRGGVLVVPGMATDADAWEKRVAANQAQYRGNRGNSAETDES